MTTGQMPYTAVNVLALLFIGLVIILLLFIGARIFGVMSLDQTRWKHIDRTALHLDESHSDDRTLEHIEKMAQPAAQGGSVSLTVTVTIMAGILGLLAIKDILPAPYTALLIAVLVLAIPVYILLGSEESMAAITVLQATQLCRYRRNSKGAKEAIDDT